MSLAQQRKPPLDIIFMTDRISREQVDLIRSLGASIIPVSGAQEGFLGSIRIDRERALPIVATCQRRRSASSSMPRVGR
jgi:cysteine synthase